MTDIMMQIGDYPFSLGAAAYQTLKRKGAYRWQSQSCIGRKPARLGHMVDVKRIFSAGSGEAIRSRTLGR